MPSDSFLESEAARRIFKRAANIGGVSISVFDYADEREGDACVHCGPASEACAYVAELPWGAQACRRSREKAAVSSLKRSKPVPFLCHMGFSCVAMQALSIDDSTQAMVLGPFCPSEAPDSLEGDALSGLSALENRDVNSLPFTLDDIPRTSAESLPDVADWLCETLTDGYISAHTEPEPEANVEAMPSTRNLSRGLVDATQAAFDSGAIVAALVGGDTKQARLLVHSQITDTASRRRTRITVKRARSVAVVASVLEWAEHADVDTMRCWKKFNDFQDAVHTCDGEDEITTAAMKVLSPIHRQKKFPTKPKTKTDYDFVPLNKLIKDHFKDGITLNTVAKTLNENPTTITKRLQRTFGMSFSDYVGRMKIDHAKKLLCTTKQTVGDIGKRVGVNDTTNFSKLFRKHEHTTPTKFRAQYGKKK